MDHSALRCACAPGRCGSSALVLAVILVLAAGAAVWLGLKSQDSDERQQERAAASSVASQFALRMDNVDGTDFDGYIKGINELLTTKAKTKNQKTFDAHQAELRGRQGEGHRQGPADRAWATPTTTPPPCWSCTTPR